MNCTVFESKGNDLIEVLFQHFSEDHERNVEDLSLSPDLSVLFSEHAATAAVARI